MENIRNGNYIGEITIDELLKSSSYEVYSEEFKKNGLTDISTLYSLKSNGRLGDIVEKSVKDEDRLSVIQFLENKIIEDKKNINDAKAKDGYIRIAIVMIVCLFLAYCAENHSSFDV